MSDLALLVDLDGATLDASDGDVLTLRRSDGTAVSRVGLRAIDSVVIDASASITSQALRQMAKCGVGLVVVGNGRHADVFWMQPAGAAAHLRHAQHLAVANIEKRLVLARHVLHAKLTAQEEVLERCGAPAAAAVLVAATARLAKVQELAGLRGVEGAAARVYWASWGRQWPADWQFSSRNRRPPGDPINALLSLGYTLATSEATRQAAAVGFDPWLGIVHETRPPAVALALDLVEGARPVVDEWVSQLVQRESLRPEHFVAQDDGGVRLQAERRRGMYADWFSHGLPAVRQRLRHGLRAFTALLTSMSDNNPHWAAANADDDQD